jgi:hypothetical protein
MKTKPTFEELQTAFEDVLAKERAYVRCGIDAAACQTRADWDRAHEAHDEALEAKDAFEKLLRACAT